MLHMKKMYLMVLSTLCLSSIQVQAEETKELEEVKVVSESSSIEESSYIELEKEANVGKMDVTVQETPFSISVIDETFIKDTGAKNVEDALQYTSGVFAGAFGFDTRIDAAAIRGLNASWFKTGLWLL